MYPQFVISKDKIVIYMASVHIYLKGAKKHSPNSSEETENSDEYQTYLDTKLQIYCSLSTANKRIKVYTKKRIQPRFWDFKKERANTKIFKRDGVILNEFLNELVTEAERLGEQNENNGLATSLQELQELVKPKQAVENTQKDKIDFEHRFNAFIGEHKTEKGFGLRANTVKKYNTFKSLLIEFSKNERLSLELNRIELDTLHKFQSFLNKKEEMSDGTKAKYIKAFKTFIKFYQRKGLIKHFLVSEVKVTEPEGEIYVLPLQRLIELQKFKFNDKRLSAVRDQFCFMCWTGQRFSDYVNLKRNSLIKDDYGKLVWQLSANKIVHGRVLMVPIIEYAQEILNNYGTEELPIPSISNQKFNDALKEMGMEAGIDFSVTTIKFYNGISRTKTVPFYEKLSAHIARKTYITNSLLLGVPERVVREVSDHKDEKSFRRYVKLADSYKTSMIHRAFNKENVERTLQEIGNCEKFGLIEAA